MALGVVKATTAPMSTAQLASELAVVEWACEETMPGSKPSSLLTETHQISSLSEARVAAGLAGSTLIKTAAVQVEVQFWWHQLKQYKSMEE